MLEKAQIVAMTPTYASEILTGFSYERQRSIKARQVTNLANIIKAGKFKPINPITIGKAGQAKKLLNGYHTLEAIVEAGQTVDILRLEVEVQSESELDVYYCLFDSHAVRSSSDKAKALRFAGRLDLNTAEAGVLYSALRWVNGSFIRKAAAGVSESTLQETRRIYEPQIEQYAQMIQDYTSKGDLIRKFCWNWSTLAVALISLRCDPVYATKFWEEVAMGTANTKRASRKIIEWQANLVGKKVRMHQELRLATVGHIYVRGRNSEEILAINHSQSPTSGDVFKEVAKKRLAVVPAPVKAAA